MITAAGKTEREAFRLTPEQKQAMNFAAQVSGVPKSELIRRGMLKEAVAAMERVVGLNDLVYEEEVSV